jgi:hypothetical protein
VEYPYPTQIDIYFKIIYSSVPKNRSSLRKSKNKKGNCLIIHKRKKELLKKAKRTKPEMCIKLKIFQKGISKIHLL